jgi:DNA-binding transcriptional LysR family regulator
MRMVATEDYVRRKGRPEGPDDLPRHDFVGHANPESRAPFMQWLRAHVPAERIVFRTADNRSQLDAILSGAGIGFMPDWECAARPGLVEIMPPLEAWEAPIWIVTHVDLHRTPKVQAFLSFLKSRARDWDFG